MRKYNTLVFGGAGFIGSHLVEQLAKHSVSTLVIDNFVVGSLKYLPDSEEYSCVDVINKDIVSHLSGLESILSDADPEYIYNYAAYPYIPQCYEDPQLVFDVNATAAINLILRSQKLCPNLKMFVQISSAELYGNRDNKNIVEPKSTYGAAKAAVDFFCQATYKERGTQVLAVRQFNCVGARETHPYVIPEIISQLHKANVLHTLLGKPQYFKSSVNLGNNTIRDFMDVRDAVQYHMFLAKNGKAGQVYDLGSTQSIDIHHLVRLCADVMDIAHVDINFDCPDKVRKNEIWRLEADNSSIYQLTSCRPKYSLRESIEYAYQYFVNNGNKWDWEDGSVSQVGSRTS